MDNSDQHEAVDMVCQMRVLTKSFTAKICSYLLTEPISVDIKMVVRRFDLGGHTWAINFSPYPGYMYDVLVNYMIFSVSLSTKTTTEMFLEVEFSLLNYETGEYSIGTEKCSGKVTKQGDYVCVRCNMGFSHLLKDGCFLIKCSVRLFKSCPKTRRIKVLVPASDFVMSDLYQHSIHLWETGEGADVAFKVSDDIITAHKSVLIARSPVFRAQFFSPMIESRTDCVIKVEDMKPKVFKLVLHFIYTDSLPLQKDLSPELAQHVLVAADRYGLERLNLICEEKLSAKLSVETAVTTLVLAEQHNCEQLKEICIEFVASQENFFEVAGDSLLCKILLIKMKKSVYIQHLHS